MIVYIVEHIPTNKFLLKRHISSHYKRDVDYWITDEIGDAAIYKSEGYAKSAIANKVPSMIRSEFRVLKAEIEVL